ncbi:condensation domain-containing protein [Dactylosporangium sp. CA-052675]|uniref:condensation domain-containing protein n=1 Tax=Dactylosporangium sp. CA-052675 TaxID=3239927 RepID=UPI003D8B67E8
MAVHFRAEGAGPGPLTWGQLAIWEVLRWLPAHDASLNITGSCAVPAGVALPDVRAAVGALVERHDSLRSRYFDTPDGPRQQVRDRGELAVPAHDVGEGSLDDAIAHQLRIMRAGHFDDAVDLPLRVAVLTDGGRPVRVLMVVSHMAVDGWSYQILLRDLTALLAGEALGPVGQQPLRRAAFEASEPGRRREARTLAYWAERLARTGDRMMGNAGAGPVPRLAWAEILSPALAAAILSLSARYAVRPSAIAMAATAVVLSEWTGQADVSIRTIVATRFQPESRDMVAAFNQNALFHLPVREEGRDALFRRAGDAAMRAYRNSECDPRKLSAVIDAVAAERGIAGRGYCFFNDVRFAREGRVVVDVDAADEAARRVPALRHLTRVSEVQRPRTPKDANFFLYLNEIGDRADLTLCVREGFLGTGTPADFLRRLERMVLDAALDPRYTVRQPTSTHDR